MSKRRELRLEGLPEISAEARRLQESGYDRAGTWSLGQVCNHLAILMEMSVDGFPFRFPWLVRKLMRMMFLGSVMKRKPLRLRAPAPGPLKQPEPVDDEAGITRLEAAVQRIQQSETFVPSPVFGRLTPEEWRQLHLWHSEHHLSFLLPHKAENAVATGAEGASSQGGEGETS